MEPTPENGDENGNGTLELAEEPCGYLEAINGNQIPIYQLGTITNSGSKIENAVRDFRDAYDSVKNSLGNKLVSKITEMHIYDEGVSPEGSKWGGIWYYKKDGDKLIFGVRIDFAGDAGLFEYLADGTITPTIVASRSVKKGLRLANGKKSELDTVPTLGHTGTGFFSRKGFQVISLDEKMAQLLNAKAIASRKTPSAKNS